MKKTILVVCSLFFLFSTFAQRQVVDRNKGICTDPSVTITVLSFDETTFTATFTPNAECARYDYVALTDEDINMYSAMAPLENLISMWGVHATGADTHTWTEMEPNTTYKILVRPFDASDAAYSYSYIEVTTLAIGGSGTSIITISINEITENSARVIFTPNDQTALYYDGLVEAGTLDELGLEELKNYLMENPMNLHYEEDDWVWPSLEPGTEYYALAFGQNADGVWGEDALMPFSTLEGDTTGINGYSFSPIVLYPMPSNGDFNISGKDLIGSTAQIFNMNGQFISQYVIDGDHCRIKTALPAGSYLFRLVSADGSTIGKKTIVIQ